ncbi:MAG: carbamoyltransferase HypF [Anaerolineaceae bacterium]|nr:carbamoyltransferase HypF [Anaerolineaceae bacterium]
MSTLTYYLHISGIVQGVGFRPHVYNLAVKHNLTGWVCNSSKGVEIKVCGEKSDIDTFTQSLKTTPPVLAQIDRFDITQIEPCIFDKFSIIDSSDKAEGFIPISPDIAICSDCRDELFDINNWRYRYPFINCINCGPRFTITEKIPYDRPNTSMANFPMCDFCQSEYENPLDRRFHAQPIACPDCGPYVWFESEGKTLAKREAAIQLARTWIKNGKILAVKGLGGFHLVCDAGNTKTVQELRERKHRTDNPFALMAHDLNTISYYCHATDEYAKLLLSPQAPIVIFPAKATANDLLANSAPGQVRLGFMLPYTPLHMLLTEPEDDFPQVLVMTSGNLSEEPIAFENDEALLRLGNLADGFLMHNRPIFMRNDDSIFTSSKISQIPVRRSRGYAPNPIRLSQKLPTILGTGTLLKNTFCLSRDNYAFVSHYIGNLDNFETLQSYKDAITHYENLFRIKPEYVACDLHPDYLARRYGVQRAEADNLHVIDIQHHHAHIAACMAENKWNTLDPVIGLSFDGTGFGTDGNIWGGEILVASYKGFERRFHLKEMSLPGGDASILKPSRLAFAYLLENDLSFDANTPSRKALSDLEVKVLSHQVTTRVNTSITSSMGRLFDIVSSLTDMCHTISYEAQAAIELEAIADPIESGYYTFGLEKDIIHVKPMIENVLVDLQNHVPKSIISAKFHQSIIRIGIETAKIIRSETGIKHVALSGGVWQNLYLFEHMLKELEQEGFIPLIHKTLPPNDACVSLGQVMISARQIE